MFEPRDLTPDPEGQVSRALDRLAQDLPQFADQVLFECTPDGALIDANSLYFDVERAAGLGEGDLAAKLVTALAPAGESVSASFALELLGVPRHFHVRFVPVSTLGRNDVKFAGIMGNIAGGIDEARGAAAEWQRDELVRVNSDWYWETNALGLLTSVSRPLELLVGQPAGGLLGRPLSAVGTLHRGENGEMPIELARTRGSSFRDQLMSIDTEGGATRLYRLAGVAVWDREGGGSGYRGVAAVVPNSARLIESMRSELGRTAKQHFLAAMSHELRTPLNAIIGFAEAMSHEVHGPLRPQYVDYAGDIAGAGRHLLGLIQDLLDISSLDSGDIDLTAEIFDIAALVDQARSMVAVSAEARNIDIRGVALIYPVAVRADKRRTLQILVNLLGNAVKFTPEGGLVGCELGHESDTHEVAVTVWDTGPGIAPKDHARVFEKFEQLANQPHISSGEGTGLGLHISRRLAGLMGGSVTLASKLGQGARFTLTLPSAD